MRSASSFWFLLWLVFRHDLSDEPPCMHSESFFYCLIPNLFRSFKTFLMWLKFVTFLACLKLFLFWIINSLFVYFYLFFCLFIFMIHILVKSKKMSCSNFLFLGIHKIERIGNDKSNQHPKFIEISLFILSLNCVSV